MRSEAEIYQLIQSVAMTDDNIRQVLLQGSRANVQCPKDSYQDYDVSFYVTDMTPYYDNLSWIEKQFGTPLLVQLPEKMKHPLLPPDNDGHFTYLIIFDDYVRMDLSFYPGCYEPNDEPAVVLLDKENRLPELLGNAHCYDIQKPTAKLYADVCNEFWWCLNNVAKGIAREELPYAMEMFNQPVRAMLNQMVEWYIGIRTDFSVSAGKLGKYYKRYLPITLYEQYRLTYARGEYDALFQAVDIACVLFHTLALEVAKQFGYLYHEAEEAALKQYLCYIRESIKRFSEEKRK